MNEPGDKAPPKGALEEAVELFDALYLRIWCAAAPPWSRASRGAARTRRSRCFEAVISHWERKT